MEKTARTPLADTDNLIYIVVALPGGCDGLDQSSRGGPVWAFTTRQEAEKKVGKDSRYKIQPKVISGRDIRLGLKRKLRVEERLYLWALGVDLDRP
jgi:hypothetical protein